MARVESSGYTSAGFGWRLPLIAWMRDDPQQAIELLDEQRSQLGEAFDTYTIWVVARTFHTLLYQRRIAELRDHIAEHMPRYERSYLARLRFIHMHMQYLLGRAALVACTGALDAAARGEVMRNARSLRAMRRADAGCLADGLEASVARREGQPEVALRLLQRCIDTVDDHQMDAYALYAAHWQQRITGKEHPLLADEPLARQGIRNPDRWVDAYMPG